MIDDFVRLHNQIGQQIMLDSGDRSQVVINDK